MGLTSGNYRNNRKLRQAHAKDDGKNGTMASWCKKAKLLQTNKDKELWMNMPRMTPHAIWRSFWESRMI